MNKKDEIIKQLKLENNLLKKENAELKALLKKALDRIDELERKLNLTSEISNRPPSSDGLKKKPAPQSLREKSGKKSGGQPGHKGVSLKQSSNPHHIKRHKTNTCSGCKKSLSEVPINKIIKRQIIDIPTPIVEVTEHQAEVKVCTCGKKNTADFPDKVNAPVQYGDNIATIAGYLSLQQFVPEKRLQEVFQDIFQLKISKATLANMVKKLAKAISPIQQQTLQDLKGAPVKHLDETGLRIAGKLWWLHSISHGGATCYRISKKRGEMFDGLTGVAVHDGWKPYFKMENVVHALCNAHHLRELKALAKLDQEYWAIEMTIFLCSLNVDNPQLTEVDYQDYRYIIKMGLDYHNSLPPLSSGRRKGHNLLRRLKKFENEVLLFARNPDVPFTNNQAEQDIRMMKVKQKISGGFRSEEGAQAFCTIRAFLSTCRKNGINLFLALSRIVDSFQKQASHPIRAPG